MKFGLGFLVLCTVDWKVIKCVEETVLNKLF